MRKYVVGVMGPGEKATDKDKQNAIELGKLIASNGWILLSGGRNIGVMDAVSKGARQAGSLTIGIIPTNNNDHTSEFVDIAIVTSMASARNNINVLSSDVVIACGMEAGTASEVAMALKAHKHVILLADNEEGKQFFKKLNPELIQAAATPVEAISFVSKHLNG